MKLVVDLPDWCDERHIWILAGIELAAYKLFGEDVVHVKTERCNQCGQCCENLNQKAHPFLLKEDGSCVYLLKNKECKLREFRPWVCCTGLQQIHGKDPYPKCTVDYKIEKVKK